MPVAGLLAWRHVLPLRGRWDAPVQPQATPEREQLAEEVTDARRPVGLDVIVFGDWPGTYSPVAVNWGSP